MDRIQYIAESFECPVCGQKFTTVYDAFGHLNDKHPADDQQTEPTSK